MKKFLCLLLSAMIIVTCFGMVAVSASNIDEIYTDSPISHGGGDIYGFTAWANYVYICKYEQIYVNDINTGERVAEWSMSRDVTGLVPNYMRPKRIVVTDDYIVVLTGNNSLSKYLVVYENSGVYDMNTPPRRIGTYGFFDSVAPSLFVKGDNIYVADRKTTSAIADVFGKGDLFKGDIIVWQINIPLIEENGAITSDSYGEYVDILNQDLYDAGAVDFQVIGNHDYLWNVSTSDEDYMYIGVYNDKLAIPSETLMVKKVAFDGLTYNEDETGIILTDYNVGMGITYTTADRNMTHKQLREQLKALPVYEVGVPNDENPLLGDFEDSLTVEILDTEDSEQNENYTVKIIITNLGDIVAKVKFDESRGEVTTNNLTTTTVADQRLIGFTNELGQEFTFKYIQPANSYQDGAIGLAGDYLYVFANGDAKSYAGNRLYICEYKDGAINVTQDKGINSAGEGSKVLTAVGAGDYIFGTVQQTGTKVWFLSTDNAPDISMSWPGNVNAGQGSNAPQPLASEYRNIVHHGSRIYYTTYGNVVRVNVPEDIETTIESKESFDDVVYLHGFTGEEEIIVKIDDAEQTILTGGGVWAAQVTGLEAGEHEVEVTAGGESVSQTITVADSGKDIEASKTVNSITFEMTGYNAAKAIITEGDNVYTVDGIDGVFTKDGLSTEGKTYEVVFVDVNGVPVCDSYTYAGDSFTADSQSIVIGGANAVADLVCKPNAVEKTINVSGTYSKNKTVFLEIKSDGTTKAYMSAICNADGEFAFTYNYTEDGTYTGKLTTVGSVLNSSISVTPIASGVVEGIITEIKGLADGTALDTYLSENTDAAEALGIDLNGDYSQLNPTNKKAVMNDVLAKIKADKADEATGVFETKTAEKFLEQREDDALEAVNGATKSSIGGIFEEYKEVIFADEEGQAVWEDYLDNKSKKSKIHSLFVGYGDCEDIDEVVENLKKAIKKANEKEEGGGGSDDSRADVGASSNIGYTAPKEPVEIYEPIQPKAFNDVANDFWGYEAITTLATRGIIDGVGNGNFAPETTVTREAFVKMLVEALGLKANGTGKVFSDVDSNAWYAEYVNIASSIGLVEGYDGKFGIGESLTREQMATMLYRAANLANIKLENKVDAKDFTDSEEIGEYAVEAVNALYQAGIVNGMADGSYAPKTVCTRAMAAKVIYEILAIK